MAQTRFEHSPNYVQSLARGLQVLRAFNHAQRNASLSQVAQTTGLSRAVARRLLLTLQHLGYVGSRGRDFFLTPRVLELGYSYLGSLDLSEMAFHDMEQLTRRVGETCSMAVLDGTDIVYVLCMPVKRIISVSLSVGARLPAFATSMGRVLLAELPDSELADWLHAQKFRAYTAHTLHTVSALTKELRRVRRQGYALAMREQEPQVCAIAVPIHDSRGRVAAALNVVTTYSENTGERLQKQILPELRAAQESIEQAIRRAGWVPLATVVD